MNCEGCKSEGIHHDELPCRFCYRVASKRPKLSDQFVQAEPVVLTTSDYMNLALSEPGKWENKDIATAFQQGKKNGRLERDLELRGLVKASIKYRYDMEYKKTANPDPVILALKNLKPLNNV